MAQPSSRIQETLLVALRKVQNSTDVTAEEAEWVRHYAARLIAEFSVIKAETDPSKPSESVAA